MAGLALLIPAAIGLNDNGPTILSPLPALTVLPAFILGFSHLWKAAIALPMLFFFVWLPGLFYGEGKIPKRSYGLLAGAIVLNVLWFIWGWKFGLDYQGAQYTFTVCIVNVTAVLFLAVAFYRNWGKESSFVTNLTLHWILFAWLAWYAFPYLGELP
jgi:hypothetical protein